VALPAWSTSSARVGAASPDSFRGVREEEEAAALVARVRTVARGRRRGRQPWRHRPRLLLQARPSFRAGMFGDGDCELDRWRPGGDDKLRLVCWPTSRSSSSPPRGVRGVASWIGWVDKRSDRTGGEDDAHLPGRSMHGLLEGEWVCAANSVAMVAEGRW
jgi:hypothetical protein